MLIGFTGKAGCGKDTAADILRKITGMKRYSFASPIYELAERWLGLSEGYYHRDIKESLIAIDLDDKFYCLDIIIYDMFKNRHEGITPVSSKICGQTIIDTLATDNCVSLPARDGKLRNYLITSPRRILQVIGTEGFRNVIDQDFWVNIAPVENVIISDVRFDNEADWIDRNDGYVFRVDRPSDDIQLSDHASEQGIKDGYVWHDIDNYGTLEDLAKEVKYAYEKAEEVSNNK